MTLAERRVHHLRLTAVNAQLVRRGALLLEDALRTVSLPGGNRPLYVRRLMLNSIDSRQSPAALALQIEMSLQQLASTAVHGSSRQASQAAAVYFHDTVEPAEQLALRLIRGQPVTAWFWPRAVPGWQPQQPLPQALRHIVQHLLQTDAGPAAVARLADVLHTHASLDPLLTMLSSADGTALLYAFGWSPTAISGHAALPEAMPPEMWIETLAQWLPRWGSQDPRVQWLTGVALAAPDWHQLANSGMMVRIQAVVARLALNHKEPSPNAPQPVQPTAPSQPQNPSERGPDTRESKPATTRRDSAQRQTTPVSASSLTVTTAVPARTHLNTQMPSNGLSTFAGQPTAAGGLFFLIPILERLDMANFLETHTAVADAAFPWRMLDQLCRRLKIAETDAIWQALPPLPSLPNLPFTTPVSWQNGIWQQGDTLAICRGSQPHTRLLLDGSRRLPLALWRGSAPAAVHHLCNGSSLRREQVLHDSQQPDVLVAWLTAVRRWSRRMARLGLADIVQRPAAIAITPTHLDIFFDFRQADIAIRRAGLDINPGWVRWLGRVVSFHYIDRKAA